MPSLKIWFAILRRSPVDPRARRALFSLAGTVLTILLPVVLPFFMFRGVAPPARKWAFILAFESVIVVALLMAVWIRRREERRRVALAVQDTAPRVRDYLWNRAQALTAIVARLAVEAGLDRQPERPTDRASVNSLLRQRGLWEKLERHEAEWLSAPEGTWGQATPADALLAFERLRLLRWVVSLDSNLSPLATFPDAGGHLSLDVFTVDQSSKPFRSTWEVRLVRDEGRRYAARILGELSRRGIGPSDPQVRKWAALISAYPPDASTDMWAGAKVVGELDTAGLHRLGGIALARATYADYLVDQLSATTPVSFEDWEAASRINSGHETNGSHE